MPGSSKPFRKLMVAMAGSPDKFRAKYFPSWLSSQAAQICALALLYIVASASLIQCNAWLLTPDRFPYPDALCVMQQALMTCVAWGLFFAKQSWFPAAEVLWNDWGLLAMKDRFLPMGVAVAFSLFGMMVAYAECSRSVVSMMQDCNLVIVLVLSYCLDLERTTWITALSILAVFAGALMVFYTFSPIRWTALGIFAQVTGQVLYLSWLMAQDIIMKGQERVKQVDPQSLVLLTAPTSLIVTSALFLSSHHGRNDLEPYLTPFVYHLPFLVFNGFLALVVSFTTTYVIKRCGAMGLLIVHMLSNILIVLATSLSVHGPYILFNSHFGHLQLYGCTVGVLGIMHYCVSQAHIDCLEEEWHLWKVVRAYRRMLGLDASNEKEWYREEEGSSEWSESEQLVGHP